MLRLRRFNPSSAIPGASIAKRFDSPGDSFCERNSGAISEQKESPGESKIERERVVSGGRRVNHLRVKRACPLLAWLVITVVGVVSYSGSSHADDITVLAVQYTWNGGVYQIDAQVNLELSPQIHEALNKGVPVILALDIAVERERGYWWDERIASLEQRYQLRYHALTSQYIVTNLNTSAQRNLPSLDAALTALGQIDDVPVLDRQLLDSDESFLAKLRVRVDVTALPAPLRLWSYVRSGWRLSSEWYTWKLVM